jgi:hypothetical protein
MRPPTTSPVRANSELNKTRTRAKRLRYRYLNVPALLVTSGRRLVLKLQRGYPLLDRFIAALTRMQSLPLPVG